MPVPTNWTSVPVAGRYIYADGSAASGTVTFTNTLYLRDPDEDVVIIPKPVQFILDGTGSFSGTLLATDDPDIDPAFFYTVTEVIGGVTTSFPMLVPKDQIGTLQMADVDRNATIPPAPEVYVRTINGMYGDVYTGDFGLPTAGTTVVSETAFGQSSAVGIMTTFAREDHTHGTPAAPSIPSAYGSTPTSNAVTATGAAGASTSWARGDHQHAGPGFGAVTAQTSFGASSGNGAAATVARSDHTHGTPAAPSVPSAAGTVASETTYGLSSTAGAASTYSRGDHSHGTQALPTAAQVGAIPNTNGITYVGRGLLSARPAAGTAGRTYLASDLSTEFYDDGTTWIQLDQAPAIPNTWTAIGHSYLQFAASSYNQRSRLDSILRGRWDVEPTNWVNLAIAGSRLTVQGAAQGGWSTMFREVNKLPAKTAPYTSSDGGLLICTGINDLGTLGGATAQMQTAFGHAVRTAISRWRASTIFETTASNTAFGGTWTTETTQQDTASGGEWRYTTANAATVTITLPADYNGEPVVPCFIGRPGANGATITFTGTALAGKPELNSTINLNDVMPAASLSNVPVIKRITSLTSANAGQTIICTTSSNIGLIYYDGWWLEAKEAPPVIVCNVARPTAAAISATWPGWTAQTGSHDNDVAAFNTVITNVKAEFDSMVQIADIDSVLAKTAANFTDGLHPNEIGAARCVDEIDYARRRLAPTGTSRSPALNMNMAPRYAGGQRFRRRKGYYHTSEHTAAGSAYALVAGDMFAIPFEVTEMDEKFDRFALEKVAAGSATGTIRWGIYADYMGTGYPDIQLQELTFGGALTVTNVGGVQLNPAAQFTWYADIGLWWLVMKIETAGTGITLATVSGPNPYMPPASTAGAFTSAPRAVGWKLTGQATGAFTAAAFTTFPAGATPIAAAPYIGLLKS